MMRHLVELVDVMKQSVRVGLPPQPGDGVTILLKRDLPDHGSRGAEEGCRLILQSWILHVHLRFT
jgi:hypothetical protein